MLTTEEVLADIRRLRERDYNTANTPRDYNTARGINLQYSNIEYSNKASNLAEDSAGDLLASLETSSPVGEVKEEGLVGQEKGVKEIAEEEVKSAPSGIYNPAKIWGVEAQQCAKNTKRPGFHISIQTYGQVATRDYNKYTIYTYPYDRLREYKPEGEEETALYEYGRANKDVCIGRVTMRSRKGAIIDGLYAVVKKQDGYNLLTLTCGDEIIEILLNQEPTVYQKQKNYEFTGSYGQPITFPSRRTRIRFEDSLTYSEANDE